MTRYWRYGLALLLALGVTGCGRFAFWRTTVDTPADTTTHLAEAENIDLAGWIGKSREELARMSDEAEETVRKHVEGAHAQSDIVELLPDLHPPTWVPVFQSAKLVPALGISVPPYAKSDGSDPDLALHLAHFGDVEGAGKLARADLHERLGSLACEKNYPVEWTRLVGLTVVAAQWKLAMGDPDGASELIAVHKQLRSVLDARAYRGPLGAVLLPAGKRALAQAAEAWRQPARNKIGLAEDVEAALRDWGEAPPLKPTLTFGASADEVARLLGASPSGRAIVALEEKTVARALDLLCLPVPREGVRQVAAVLDGKGALAELTFFYPGKVENLYPEATHVAFLLLERGAVGKDPERGPGLVRQTFTVGEQTFEVARATQGNALGAVLNVRPVKPASEVVLTRALRDFGPASLDRSFETNRVAVAPQQNAARLTVSNKQVLADMVRDLRLPPPSGAALQRAGTHDLVGSLSLTWPADLNPEASARLLPPLWAALGAPKLASAEDAGGGHMTFTWEGATRLELQLPFDDRPPELVAEDSGAADKLAERAAAVHQRDLQERKDRLAAGTPALRLPRGFEVLNDLACGLELGQSREQASASAPRGSTIRQRPTPDGFTVLFTGNPESPPVFYVRQVFVRLLGGRVAELRLRYQESAPQAGSKQLTLLQTLASGKAGKPEEVTADWAGLWTGLPANPSKPVKLRWQDDRTILTYQHDAWGSEVVLRDRPADRPEGADLPVFTYLPGGVDRCVVGAERAEALKGVKTAADASSGMEAFRLPASSPYESLMLWTAGGKISRVVAVHRARPEADARGAGLALQQAWVRDLDKLGYVRRIDGARGAVLGAYCWHDDRLRVQTYAQDTEQGPRLFTEWQPWPVQEKKVEKKETAAR